MKLGELIADDVIVTGFAARDRWEAIEKLLDVLVKAGRVPADHRAAALDALVARENIASTGMEHGIALPHATVDAVDDARVAVGISRAGIPFQSADNQPARIIVLLLIPRKGVQKHIRTLAGIARVLNFEEMRQAIQNAATAAEVVRVIREEEQKNP